MKAYKVSVLNKVGIDYEYDGEYSSDEFYASKEKALNRITDLEESFKDGTYFVKEGYEDCESKNAVCKFDSKGKPYLVALDRDCYDYDEYYICDLEEIEIKE